MFTDKIKKFPATAALKNVIYISIVFYTLILLAIVVVSFACIQRIDHKVYSWIQFNNIDRQILEVRRYEKTYLLYHSKEDLLYALDYIEKLEIEIPMNEPMITKKLNIKKELNTLLKLIKEYKELLMAIMEKKKISQKSAYKIREKGHEITEFFSNIRKNVTKKLNRDIKLYSSIPIMTFFLVFLIVPLAAYLLAKWVIDPIEYLATNAKKVSKGYLEHIPLYKRFILRYREYIELTNAINDMLTALNEKQKELLQIEKMAAIGTVISGIAHEINNPLNNMFLTIDVIKEHFDDLTKEEVFEMLQDIYREGERAREIIIHLLEFARSKKDIHIEPVDVVKLIKDSYKIINNQLKTQNIESHLTLPEKTVKILGNFNQLQQVLVNIMVNAIQSMREGGKLTIKAYLDKENVVIEISDTGQGIPGEIKEKIFEPFFTTKEKGTGLGLSVSYNIIKKYKGDIKVESEPGKGTVFKIILPYQEE